MKQKLTDFSKVTVILRGYNYQQVEAVVEVMKNSKINAVEITLNRGDSKTIIKKIVQKYGQEISVGAGTVLNEADLKDVVNIGVDFVLAPNMFSKKMLEFCRENQVISVPGAYSPTEIYQSIKDGADIVKVFPADIVGSKFFKDIRAPFGELPLMAVGGINIQNVREYFLAGAKYVGIASGIFQTEDIVNSNKDSLKKSLEDFEEKIEGA